MRELNMGRLLRAVLLVGAVLASAATPARPQQLVNPRPALGSDNPSIENSSGENPSGDLDTLPPAPTGKSTILGGAIKDFDPVRDQFSLHIYGERPMKILFDERTQVYLDGKKIPVRDLGPEEHASVQTILDGTNVFALSIHILSQTPEGDTEGQVLSYDARTGELEVRTPESSNPVRLIVTESTAIARAGEPAFASAPSGANDLVPGALVSIAFQPRQNGHDIASHITVLAVPGSSFLFSGSISTLDMDSGSLILVDPRDEKSYQIHFDSAYLPISWTLHLGQSVTVQARYDGSRYQATEITAH